MALLRGVIGVVLRRARTLQGKTLKTVADEARVSVQYLSEVERGRKEASSEVLAAVCAALGWTIVNLLDAAREELAPISRVEITGFAVPAAPMLGREPVPQATATVQLVAA
jgi:transcriptional regulator with XRE-family HTH domain